MALWERCWDALLVSTFLIAVALVVVQAESLAVTTALRALLTGVAAAFVVHVVVGASTGSYGPQDKNS